MKNLLSLIICGALFSSFNQAEDKISLHTENLIPYGVQLKAGTYKGKEAIVMEQAGDNDKQYTYALLKNADFHNGTIELNLAGQPKKNAISTTRGFVGIVFRASADTSNFELIYLRPSNGRANDQVRRNHAVQYVSHPGYPWEKLRKEFPEKYESYADLIPGEWTKIKIEVKDETAQLYINGNAQPSLIVNDLRQGKDKRGSIGLWIGIGTLAQFNDLRITKAD
jgi:hypothetical protein